MAFVGLVVGILAGCLRVGSYTMGLSSGGPTLVTQYADASYDDLKVCPLSP